MFRYLLAALAVAPATAHAASSPVVLELFTSESCSSCPPADALLAELARTRSDVLPLGFHVDYWNALSWRDRFSSAAATARQRDYAETLGAGVYTPQIVVNGHFQAVGSDRDAVMAAIAQAQAAEQAAPGVTVAEAAGRVTVDVGAGQGSGAVLLVAFDNLHSTSVGSGENAGRTVTEANVVRSLAKIGLWQGAVAHFTVPRPAGDRVAVLLQDPTGRILAARQI